MICAFLLLTSNICTLDASTVELNKVPPVGLILGRLDPVMGQVSIIETILRYVTNFMEDISSYIGHLDSFGL